MSLEDLQRDYPHLTFRKCWRLNERTLLNLGQCVAIINCLAEMPISPKLQKALRRVAFERGAQATTAIEGNTLTDEEVRKLLAGEELPKSREYQAREVKNALEAMRFVWQKVVVAGECEPVDPKLLCDLNRIVGQNLGTLFDGVPGRPRTDRRSVGRYLAPPHEHVEHLMSAMCGWLREEFGYASGRQSTDVAIIEAIVAHVYFEWIHPFADGNGRTGRLLEFFILLRSGLPDIAAHVLANHYNTSRSEYASHFENARKKRDLSEFLSYAVQGLLDGLEATQEEVKNEAFRVTWRSHIYEVFTDYKCLKTSVFKRRRNLALQMPIGAKFTLEELIRTSDELVREYMGRDRRKIKADLDEIKRLDLVSEDDGMYRANTDLLVAQHLAPRVQRGALPKSQTPTANNPDLANTSRV
ncbi:MAG: Fic family protein [Planctomyces sp.]|nr:Fic family protein [Planctomyces sp.]